MKAALLIALLPLAAEAQLALVSVAANGTETPVMSGSAYPFGQVAVYTVSTANFRVYNNGSKPVLVNVNVGGVGFSLSGAPALPYWIPPQSTKTQALNFVAAFLPTNTIGSFNASLTVNAISVILFGSGVPAPSLSGGTSTLSGGSGCSGSGPFSFGAVHVGSSATCEFTLQAPSSQAVKIASIVVNGPGFPGPYGITTPLTLLAGQTASFSVNFTPSGTTAFAGTLVVSIQASAQSLSTLSFTLSGTGLPPQLPTPSLQFDSVAYTSGQQGVLTMVIPGGSPLAATGYVNLAFAPSPTLAGMVADDTSIFFVDNRARTIPFSVSAGATTVTLNGQASARFQTGTTAGTLTFTITTAALMTGDPPIEQFTIQRAKVMLDPMPTASKERLGFLDITITGADNTYSTSAMTFSFFDTSGKAMDSVNADVTLKFQNYYAKNIAAGKSPGSTFQALVSFPVTGSAAPIGSVTISMTNAAGVATTGSLLFQ